jgi:hypothetical protein
VRWIDDDVEFYHRVIHAIAASSGLRSLGRSSLWQPFHDPIFAIFRRFGLRTPPLRSGQLLTLRVSAWFDPTVFHGQVTNASVKTEQEAQLQEAAITGVMTPRDNFSGRSTTNLGLAEVADLSLTSAPAATATSVGGLRWFVASGAGTLTGGDDGQATFTAGASPGSVRLELRVVSGLSAGAVMSTLNISVVAPNDGRMRKDPRAVKHTHNTWSVGFCGETFLRPTNVSFSRIEFREGTTTAVATGYQASANGVVHPQGDWFAVGAGNSTTGCQVDALDSVRTRDRPPPYSAGDFLWAIPWQYRVGTGTPETFTIANQHSTADDSGTATIEKKGSGAFSKVPSDPTVDYECY